MGTKDTLLPDVNQSRFNNKGAFRLDNQGIHPQNQRAVLNK